MSMSISFRRQRSRAFTFTEIIVVLVILVILISLGVGGWKAVVGASSVEAAQNLCSSVIGRAREEAMSVRKSRGVLFFERDGQILMASVYPDDPLTRPGQLEMVDDSELKPLQNGIGALFINNDAPRYRIPGVILFGGHGQVLIRDYAVRPNGKLGKLMRLDQQPPPSATAPTTYTHLGVTLYELNRLAGVPAAQRDRWLDTKGHSLFVNRYSGTLVEGRGAEEQP
jgi:prepilin-type N-terminal cleavage/methylation domain-containing protein